MSPGLGWRPLPSQTWRRFSSSVSRRTLHNLHHLVENIISSESENLPYDRRAVRTANIRRDLLRGATLTLVWTMSYWKGEEFPRSELTTRRNTFSCMFLTIERQEYASVKRTSSCGHPACPCCQRGALKVIDDPIPSSRTFILSRNIEYCHPGLLCMSHWPHPTEARTLSS